MSYGIGLGCWAFVIGRDDARWAGLDITRDGYSTILTITFMTAYVCVEWVKPHARFKRKEYKGWALWRTP